MGSMGGLVFFVRRKSAVQICFHQATDTASPANYPWGIHPIAWQSRARFSAVPSAINVMILKSRVSPHGDTAMHRYTGSVGVSKIMHHPRSTCAARRLRIASLLMLGSRLLMLVAGGLLVFSLLSSDRQLMISGWVLVIISVLLVVAQWISASGAGCPLCQTPVLAPMRCARHRKAKHLFGSYQLRVALGIMFTEQFRCPYCNEPTAMAVREKLRGSRPRGSEMT